MMSDVEFLANFEKALADMDEESDAYYAKVWEDSALVVDGDLTSGGIKNIMGMMLRQMPKFSASSPFVILAFLVSIFKVVIAILNIAALNAMLLAFNTSTLIFIGLRVW